MSVVVARFVGGSADGKTYAFPGKPSLYFDVAIAPPLRYFWEPDPDVISHSTFERETYQRYLLRGDTREFWVFAPYGWTLDEVYEHLLFGKGAVLSG